MQLTAPVQTIAIPDGKDEDEMWEIFNALYEELKPGDGLYFDLTHSFRYLPMLVLVLGNYAKFLKNVSVKHISYGNYEARDVQTDIAPLMDILPLTILQDWTFAAADLIRNGNTKRLQDLRESYALMPLLRMKGKSNLDRKVAEQPLTGYIDALESLLQDMKMCVAPNIIKGEAVNSIRDHYQQVINAFEMVIAPIPPILERIEESLKGFEQTDRDQPRAFAMATRPPSGATTISSTSRPSPSSKRTSPPISASILALTSMSMNSVKRQMPICDTAAIKTRTGRQKNSLRSEPR